MSTEFAASIHVCKGSEVLANEVFNKFVPKEMGAETERTESVVFILNH